MKKINILLTKLITVLLYSSQAIKSMVIAMERLLKIYNMLSDKNRLRILKLLQYKPMCVCELTFLLGIRQPSVSRHLIKLKDSGLIDSRQDKLWHEYFLSEKKDKYVNLILGQIKRLLNDDPVILADREKAKYIDRNIVCKINK